jgi:hypothetical protein
MINVQKIQDDTYVVSENQQWVPGVYETAEAAKKAVSMTNEEIDIILGPIYKIHGEGRPVNDKDMFHALEAAAELRLNNYRGDFAPEMDTNNE